MLGRRALLLLMMMMATLMFLRCCSPLLPRCAGATDAAGAALLLRLLADLAGGVPTRSKGPPPRLDSLVCRVPATWE